MTFQFDPATMSTGIERLDTQHKRLFEIVNNIEAVMKQEGLSEERMRQILQDLTEYVYYHFSYEESMMNYYRCPAAADNKMAHDNFRAEVKEMLDRYKQAGVSLDLIAELAQLVGRWFTGHICKIDTRLRPCVASQEQQGPAGSA